MHIPDGYLSPATCGVMYAAAAPFWYLALQRVKRLLNTRLVPLLAVFSAFSFVIMMFNLPLPGGTTGHAVGMGIATVVLGPWGSILAVSIALLIQALFFGDGGVTAFGANCFNMAIVGSLVAYAVYRAIAGRSAITDVRRVVAGAIAGYLAINVAALVAAIEFGLQPALFHDASGVPLYAPYPLSIAVPAMMIGHLTFAGIAELIITGGVIAYLQRADPSMLKLTAPNARDQEQGVQEVAQRGGWSVTRYLWVGLLVLALVSPLGLVASGTAWGEWSAEDFASHEGRQAIATASGGQIPPGASGQGPGAPPSGLTALSSFWSAPFPDYDPLNGTQSSLAYIISALVGGVLIIAVCLAIGWIAQKVRGDRAPHSGSAGSGGV